MCRLIVQHGITLTDGNAGANVISWFKFRQCNTNAFEVGNIIFSVMVGWEDGDVGLGYVPMRYRTVNLALKRLAGLAAVWEETWINR